MLNIAIGINICLIMLALCLILSITHYAQTYAGIKAVPARNSYIFCLNYPAILFIIGIAR